MPTLTGFKNFSRLNQKGANRLAEWTLPDDTLLQANIDLAKKNVLTKLGDPADLPDDPAIDRSVYLFAQFYTQNWNTQELVTTGDLGPFKKEKTEYYRERVWRAINMEVDNLLRPFIDVDKFQGVS